MKNEIEELKKIFWANLDLTKTTTNMSDDMIARIKVHHIHSELKSHCEWLMFKMLNKALNK